MALLTMAQVRERVPLSRATIYALMKAGVFPRGRKVRGLGNKRFWREAEIESFRSDNPELAA